ncbi:hypothetical protein [Sorangium cellulosum]|nr:hypothetical protein [Sorangium cellulosum]
MPERPGSLRHLLQATPLFLVGAGGMAASLPLGAVCPMELMS